MPIQVLPDAAAFGRFARALVRRGFRRITTSEFKQDFERLGLRAPSPRNGREVGFVFAANGLTVLVWTTCVVREREARERDAGWVLIKEGDAVKYFSHPLHRTKNFLRNLLAYASIARLRVLNRPPCPKCGAQMDIVRGKGVKARYWKCVNPSVHKKSVALSWDHELPPAALDFLHLARKRRAQYRAKLRAKGGRPDTALRRRRGWKIERPRNRRTY